MGSLWGAAGTLVDFLAIGVAGVRSGGVFAKRASVAGSLADRVAARRVRIQRELPLRRRGRPVIRAEVAIDTAEGVHTTFYDQYRQPDRASVQGLLVYHHGLGETPYDLSFAKTLLSPEPVPRVDLIAIKSTHRGALWGASRPVLSDAACWVDMLANSMAVAGHIGERFRGEYPATALSGVSLGGIVAMGVLALGDRYDLYQPLLAGPDVPAHLRESPFAWFVRRDALTYMDEERTFTGLDFRAVVARHKERVRFTVGEYDTVFRLERFRAFAATAEVPYTVIPYAHVLGGLSGGVLRAIILQNLGELFERQAAPPSPPFLLTGPGAQVKGYS
ncbi:MAG: hypothetical protein HYZ81_22535 [Nitrospinae bacterium]|nr:hypothetical protein [Nitrospinota bacterium]